MVNKASSNSICNGPPFYSLVNAFVSPFIERNIYRPPVISNTEKNQKHIGSVTPGEERGMRCLHCDINN